LRTLSEAIISVFELIEAEGRELRRSVTFILLGMVFFFVAGIVAFLGFLFVLYALYHFLLPIAGVTASCLATGATALLTASALFFSGLRCALNDISKDRGTEDGDGKKTADPGGGENEPEESVRGRESGAGD
jgi:hypothetical protein